jgi:hypothetical protein
VRAPSDRNACSLLLGLLPVLESDRPQARNSSKLIAGLRGLNIKIPKLVKI